MSSAPAPIQSLLDLFASDLRELRFADVDATTLAAAAADLEAAAERTNAAQAALDEARAAQLARQDTLTALAQRALAYARVYAEANPDLAARLDAITLPRLVRRASRPDDAVASTPEAVPPRRPRGRPRKVPVVVDLAPALDATGE